MRLRRAELLSVLLAAVQPSASAPAPSQQLSPAPASHPTRKLHGRFLQITDIHPDPFYEPYTSPDSACHRKHGDAGYYGAETSSCDAPFSLVNATFRWIEENLKDEIDFVVWTGDSARHDSDSAVPRTEAQVMGLNEAIVSKFAEVFGVGNSQSTTSLQHIRDNGEVQAVAQRSSIPIIPTFGNNDVMPHNIFLRGPNKWTSRYLDTWRSFVPESQRHTFAQGGWFWVEVIPDRLAVISMNTLFFFTSNSGVNGCAARHEPGYEHLEWLRIQLALLRERGMKAILMGHVPPARTKSKSSWDETCWQKYTLWQRQYRDVIVGNLFGHMNIDHWMIHDFKKLKKGMKKGEMGVKAIGGSDAEEEWEWEWDDGGDDDREALGEDGEITVQSASDYLVSLANMWAKLPSPEDDANSKHAALPSDGADEGSTLWRWLQNPFLPSTTAKKGGNGKKKHGPKNPNKKKKTYRQRIGGRYAERYAVSHVAPSVVPNYFPTLRVFTYNISGLENLEIPTDAMAMAGSQALSTLDSEETQTPFSREASESIQEDGDEEDGTAELDDATSINQKGKRKSKSKNGKGKKGGKDNTTKKKKRKYKFHLPNPPSKSAPPGPAYSNQPLTLLGYTQYFANLTYINNSTDVGVDAAAVSTRKEKGNGNGKKEKKKPHPREFKYEVEYDTMHDKQGYRLKDLTVRSYVDLAAKVGRDKKRQSEKKNGKGKAKKKGKKSAVSNHDTVDDDLDLTGHGAALENGAWYDYNDADREDDSDEDEDDGYASDSEDDDDEEDEGYITADPSIDDEISAAAKNGNKKKTPKKENGKEKHGLWFTFIRRAFVSTMDARQIEQKLGAWASEASASPSPSIEDGGENMEL